jgi:hypothetical protein
LEKRLTNTPGNDTADFQIVIEHTCLGPFAVHEEFVLELRSGDGAGTWEVVGLEQLKMALLDRDIPERSGRTRKM